MSVVSLLIVARVTVLACVVCILTSSCRQLQYVKPSYCSSIFSNNDCSNRKYIFLHKCLGKSFHTLTMRNSVSECWRGEYQWWSTTYKNGRQGPFDLQTFLVAPRLTRLTFCPKNGEHFSSQPPRTLSHIFKLFPLSSLQSYNPKSLHWSSLKGQCVIFQVFSAI